MVSIISMSTIHLSAWPRQQYPLVWDQLVRTIPIAINRKYNNNNGVFLVLTAKDIFPFEFIDNRAILNPQIPFQALKKYPLVEMLVGKVPFEHSSFLLYGWLPKDWLKDNLEKTLNLRPRDLSHLREWHWTAILILFVWFFFFGDCLFPYLWLFFGVCKLIIHCTAFPSSSCLSSSSSFSSCLSLWPFPPRDRHLSLFIHPFLLLISEVAHLRTCIFFVFTFLENTAQTLHLEEINTKKRSGSRLLLKCWQRRIIYDEMTNKLKKGAEIHLFVLGRPSTFFTGFFGNLYFINMGGGSSQFPKLL